MLNAGSVTAESSSGYIVFSWRGLGGGWISFELTIGEEDPHKWNIAGPIELSTIVAGIRAAWDRFDDVRALEESVRTELVMEITRQQV